MKKDAERGSQLNNKAVSRLYGLKAVQNCADSQNRNEDMKTIFNV